MKKTHLTYLILLSFFCTHSNQTLALEKIPEDDIISCYTLIYNYPGWHKEKINDNLIKPADSPYNCSNLPYKIYEGNAYKWKKEKTATADNLSYLCIKDLSAKNRYNFLLQTEKLMKTLNNSHLGETPCKRLEFLLSAPQWTTFSD